MQISHSANEDSELPDKQCDSDKRDSVRGDLLVQSCLSWIQTVLLKQHPLKLGNYANL